MIIDIPTVEGGEFVNGGPNNLGTIVTAEFLNSLMKSSTATTKEIQTVLEKASIVPNVANFDQLYQALESIIADKFDAQPISTGYSTTRKYRSGELVFVDGIWYECYRSEGVIGKDPRDSKNRPSGWASQDVHAPYYWAEIGKYLMLPEIGSPQPIATMSIREGLIKYRNDAQLSATKFWRITEQNPNLVKNGFIEIADLRANVIRGLDDGKGSDPARVINSFQADAMLKITGSIEGVQHKSRSTVSGSLYTKSTNIVANQNADMANGNAVFEHLIDSSREHPTKTANEIRMKNIAMYYCCRI